MAILEKSSITFVNRNITTQVTTEEPAVITSGLIPEATHEFTEPRFKQFQIDQRLHILKTLRAQGNISHAYYRSETDLLRSSLKQIQKGSK